MPHIEMRDPFGFSYRIDTLDWDMIGAWFHEWLPRIYPPGADERTGLPVLTVYPLWAGPGGKNPDWPTDARFITQTFTISSDPGLAVVGIERQRTWIVRQLAMHAEADSVPSVDYAEGLNPDGSLRGDR